MTADATCRPRFLTLVAVACTALVILVVRRPDAFLLPQFWAEDFLFLIEAERHGLASLLMPRAGYLHLIPRTLAWLATPLDPSLQPAFFLAGSLGVLAAVMAACLSSRHDLPAKPALALAVVLVPHTGEVFFNPTNAQWFAALALLLLVFKRDPTRPLEWLVDATTVLFAGLSGPFVLFLLPLFAFRTWSRRTRASTLLLAAVAGTACLQGWQLAHAPTEPELQGMFSAINLAANVSLRLPLTLVLGAAAGTAPGRPAVIAAGAALLLLLALAVVRARRHRTEMFLILAFIATILAVTAVRKRFDLWMFGDTWNGDRYYFIPKIGLIWIALLLATDRERPLARIAATAVVAVGLLLNAPLYHFKPYIDYGWYAQCADIRAGKKVTVKTNPDWTYHYQRHGSTEGPF